MTNEEVERRLDLMRKSIETGEVRCPRCESIEGQLNGFIVEGEEYLEKSAWCTFCEQWHLVALLEKPTEHPLEEDGSNEPPKGHDPYEQLTFDAWLDAFLATEPKE